MHPKPVTAAGLLAVSILCGFTPTAWAEFRVLTVGIDSSCPYGLVV